MGEREITARSDIYALGAVLYEMLTAEPPFTGATAQAVVARVVTESPRPLLPQRHTIPRHVEAAVLTALEKLPADRFATAAEFAEALRDKSYARLAPPRSRRPPAGRGAAPPGRRVRVLALRRLPLAPWRRRRRSGAGSARRRRRSLSQFSLALKPSQALQPPSAGGGARIALSPDGRALAYIGPAEGGTRLWLRRIDQLDATPIAGTESASNPFFSPDGQPGRVHQGRHRGADRVARGRAHGDADRQGQHHARATGATTATSTSRWTRASPGCGPPAGASSRSTRSSPRQGDRDRVGARPARRERHPVPAPPRRAGPRRLRDHGDAAAARPGALARPGRLRHATRRRAISWWSPSDGKLIGIPFDPEEARAHRPADRAARGHRGAERRLQHRPRRSPGTARWPTPPAAPSGPGARHG